MRRIVIGVAAIGAGYATQAGWREYRTYRREARLDGYNKLTQGGGYEQLAATKRNIQEQRQPFEWQLAEAKYSHDKAAEAATAALGRLNTAQRLVEDVHTRDAELQCQIETAKSVENGALEEYVSDVNERINSARTKAEEQEHQRLADVVNEQTEQSKQRQAQINAEHEALKTAEYNRLTTTVLRAHSL